MIVIVILCVYLEIVFSNDSPCILLYSGKFSREKAFADFEV